MTRFGEARIDFGAQDPVIYQDYAAALARKGLAIRQERP